MANALGNPLSPRPTEGYSKNIQASDPNKLDAAGNPIVTEVGDAINQAVRVTMANPSVGQGPDGKPTSIQGDSDGLAVRDKMLLNVQQQQLALLRVMQLTLMYLASGGLGTGATITEFLAAHGIEMDPLTLQLQQESGVFMEDTA